MNKISSTRSNASNMEIINNTNKNPASENESKQIFIKKGSTTIFQKFIAKLKSIKQAPTNAKLRLAVTPKASGQLSNIKDTNIVQKGFTPPPTDDVGPPPPTDDVGPPPPNDKLNPPALKQNQFNLEKNILKNEFKVAIKKLLPINELKIGKDHKNYLAFIERLNHLVIEIESFSSYVVNQGIDIKHPGLDYLINSEKDELESIIKYVLSLSGKNDQEITDFMADFSTQLEDLTNKILTTGKVGTPPPTDKVGLPPPTDKVGLPPPTDKIGPPPPTDKVGPPPQNHKQNPPDLKQNQFNLEKKELKNKFKDEINKLLPDSHFKVSQDNTNYLAIDKKISELKIEIESFSSYVVNQGIDIKNPGLTFLINLQKDELESEIKKTLDLTGKDNEVIEGLMKDFSTKLDQLTNKILTTGKV